MFHKSTGPATAAKGNAKTLQTPISKEDWDEHNYVKLPFYEYNVEPETNKWLWNVIKRSLTELSETLNNDFDYIHVEVIEKTGSENVHFVTVAWRTVIL